MQLKGLKNIFKPLNFFKIITKETANMKNYSLDTKCVQAGYTPKNGEPREIPIYQSTTYKYDTSEDMGKLFDLEASGYFYSRLQNPTCDYVAAKICALEGGTASSFHMAQKYSIVYAPHLLYPSLCRWTFMLLLL